MPGARHLLRHAAAGAPARRRGRARRRTASTAARCSSSSATTRSSRASPGGAERVVWMSHGDRVLRLPHGLRVLGDAARTRPSRRCATRSARSTACSSTPRSRTPQDGARRSSRTSRAAICGCRGELDDGRVHRRGDRARSARRSASGRAVCGLSGGVDSSVAAALVHRAIGDRLTCIFVDNGLLRARRARGGRGARSASSAHVHARRRATPRSASSSALARRHATRSRSAGSSGTTFIEVFEEEARGSQRRREPEFLAQGTLYPDVIESVSVRGPSADDQDAPQRGRAARAHELRAGRAAARAVQGRGARGRPRARPARRRSSGAIRSRARASRCASSARSPPERLATLRAADAIVVEEIRRAGLYDRLWQAFAVLLPVQSVGVMGDERTYENAIAVRCVDLGRRDDRGLGARCPTSVLRAISHAHHQRGARHQPRRLRHLHEAAGDDRVGMTPSRCAAADPRGGARAPALRPPAPAQPVLAARRRDQDRPALRAREGARHARGRAHRSRQPVRRGRVLRDGARAGRQADPRLRGLRRLGLALRQGAPRARRERLRRDQPPAAARARTRPATAT